MAKKRESPFSAPVFQFLGELALHNDRGWFDRNKARYEREVREPALAFVRAMAPHLGRISRNLLASDKKVGGSLMRVQRDIRFSADKSPFKTNVGIQFRHAAGKDVHAPGLYLHIEPDSVFLAAGMWHPEPDALAAVRKAIASKPAAWKKARDDRAFRKHWKIEGDSLVRPPKGFDPAHAMIEDIKRKDHIAVVNLDPGVVTRAGFVELAAERFAATKPYVGFLTRARGLAF